MSRSLFRAVNRGGQAAILRAEKSVLSFSVSSSLLPKTPMRVTSLEPDKLANDVSDEATWGKVFPVYDDLFLSGVDDSSEQRGRPARQHSLYTADFISPNGHLKR